MRVLAAENRVDLDDFLLPFQGVEVVSDGDQVDLRRQLVGWMAPVAVGEDAEAAGGEGLDLGLHVREVGGRVLVPLRVRLRQFRGFFWIGLESIDDVDPVERMQVIEVDHVVLHILRGHHDVANDFSGGRDNDAQRVFDGAYAGERMYGGANAAHALSDGPGIAGIAANENLFQATHHGA